MKVTIRLNWMENSQFKLINYKLQHNFKANFEITLIGPKLDGIPNWPN
jgi:hypothetical protein